MYISSLRCAVRVLLGIGLLPSTFQPVHAQPGVLADAGTARRQAVRCASTEDTTPSGLAVVLPPGATRDQSRDLQALKNSFITGVGVQINWRDIEPIEGKPDWSRLDALIAAAESSNKWVKLDIFPGFFSPAWALEGAKTDIFKIPYGPGHGTEAKLPMPWDRVYLNRWFAFVKQLAERYGKSPAFRTIRGCRADVSFRRDDVAQQLSAGDQKMAQ